MYVWLKATDEYGNVSAPKKLSLQVLPNGDKPKVNIEYPLAKSVLGGRITVSGTTNILTSSVKEVDFKLADGLIKIYERDIPSKFNRGVFDVITGQKSLEVEIEQLLEEMKKSTDPREKARIVMEIGIKKKQLSESKSTYIVEKGD